MFAGSARLALVAPMADCSSLQYPRGPYLGTWPTSVSGSLLFLSDEDGSELGSRLLGVRCSSIRPTETFEKRRRALQRWSRQVLPARDAGSASICVGHGAGLAGRLVIGAVEYIGTYCGTKVLPLFAIHSINIADAPISCRFRV
jgi:hypothetical protein